MEDLPFIVRLSLRRSPLLAKGKRRIFGRGYAVLCILHHFRSIYDYCYSLYYSFLYRLDWLSNHFFNVVKKNLILGVISLKWVYNMNRCVTTDLL